MKFSVKVTYLSSLLVLCGVACGVVINARGVQAKQSALVDSGASADTVTSSDTQDKALGLAKKMNVPANSKVKTLGLIKTIKFKDGTVVDRDSIKQKLFDNIDATKMSDEQKKIMKEDIQKDASISSAIVADLVSKVYSALMREDAEFNNSELIKQLVESFYLTTKRAVLVNDRIIRELGPDSITIDSTGAYDINSVEKGDFAKALQNIKDRYQKYCKDNNNIHVKLDYAVIIVTDANRAHLYSIAEPFLKKDENDAQKKSFWNKVSGAFGSGEKGKKQKAIKTLLDHYCDKEDGGKSDKTKTQKSNYSWSGSVYTEDLELPGDRMHAYIKKEFNESFKKGTGIAFTKISVGKDQDFDVCICVSGVHQESFAEFDKLSKEDLMKFRSLFALDVSSGVASSDSFTIVNSDGSRQVIDVENLIDAGAESDKIVEDVKLDLSDLQKAIATNDSKSSKKSICDLDEYKKLNSQLTVEYSVDGKVYSKTVSDLMHYIMAGQSQEFIARICNNTVVFKSILLSNAQHCVARDTTFAEFEKSTCKDDKSIMDKIESVVKRQLLTSYIMNKARHEKANAMKDVIEMLGGSQPGQKEMVSGVSVRAVVVDEKDVSEKLKPSKYLQNLKCDKGVEFAKINNCEMMPIDHNPVKVYTKNGAIAAFELKNITKKELGSDLWNVFTNGVPPRLHSEFITVDANLCHLLFDYEKKLLGRKVAVYIENCKKEAESEFAAFVLQNSVKEAIAKLVFRFVDSINNINVKDIDERVVVHALSIV